MKQEKGNTFAFSTIFDAAKISVMSLFDDVGGESAIELLDLLSKLKPSKREEFLNNFKSQIKASQSIPKEEHLRPERIIRSSMAGKMIYSQHEQPRTGPQSVIIDIGRARRMRRS